MFEFKNKTILIISPQRWGNMHVSKHHYALELARLGNKVFFLNPPDLKKKIIPEKDCIATGLCILSYKPVYRGEKYLPCFVFRFLIFLNILILKNAIGKIDIVWSFEDGIFQRLDWFNADLKIFHPVDLQEKINKSAKYADYIFSVSETILKNYYQFSKPSKFINHGLAESVAQQTRLKLNSFESHQQKKQIVAGYVGNLFMEAIDRKIFRLIVQQNPDVLFVLWGPYEASQSNLGSWVNEESLDFIEFLKKQANVNLRGVTKQNLIYSDPLSPDLYFLFYKPGISKIWDGSNSHKIIEYLNTGKVLVTHYLTTYRNTRDLIVMPDEINGNSQLPGLFAKTLQHLEYYNSINLQKARIEFALDNSYSKQICRIEDFINESRG